MLQAFPRSTTWLLSLLGVMVLLLTPAMKESAQAAADDTPVQIVNDSDIVAWDVGAGLIYWSNFCNEEFETTAELNRRPVSGNTQRTLKSINTEDDPDESCLTFQNLLSSGDGLFYYEGSVTGGRILRMPLGEPSEDYIFVPEEVKVLANSSQAPATDFVEAGDYLYWGAFGSNAILRTLKDGSGEVETVTATEGLPSDVLIAGTTLFWTDSEGVWSVETTCTPLPCAGGKQYENVGSSTRVSKLLYQPIDNSGFLNDGFRIYWVELTGNAPNLSYKIRYRFCSTGIVAFDCYMEWAPVDPGEPQPLPDPSTIFYEATINWGIGTPVLADGNLFWTESENVPNTTTGEVRRKAYNDTSAGASSIATAQSGLHSRLFAANNTLFFARSGMGIFTLPLNAAPIMRDFNLEAMEVTQGIQNLANNVPLVAEKATYVRAYAKQVSGPNTPNVEAWLVGTINDLPLPGSPLKPINGVRALTTGAAYDRARLNDGWYFLLPESWTKAGNIKMQVVVDPRHLHTDPNLGNNQVPATLTTFTFQKQPPVCVMTVPVRTHTPRPSTTDPNFWTMVSHFDRRWPVPETWIFRDTDPVEELEFCSWHGIPYPCYGPYELSDGWGLTNGIPDRDKVIASLWTRAQLSFNPDACDDIDAPVHFMGMVHPDADNGGAAGYASTVSKQSWVQLPGHAPITPYWNMREGSTMAQELAHNHGRKHINCNNPDNIDTGFPYANPCHIAPVGPDSYYGFDPVTLQPIRPDQASDFMTYGGSRWVSDYTWKALLNKFATTSAASVAPAAADQGDSVFVSGLVDAENNRGEITIVLNLPTNSLPPSTRQLMSVQVAAIQHDDVPHADFKLRLLDSQGTVIHEQPLTLTPLDDHSDESHNALFSTLFPKPAQQVATIQLLADNSVIDTITAGVSVPQVTIQQPTNGAMIENSLTIQWTASDADEADKLLFTVQYSHDGGTSWHTLAINLPSTPDPVNTLTLDDLGSLQGSETGAARIRVLASDGYNTAIATSQPFTVKNRPPEPVIIVPISGQTLVGGEVVLLQGSGMDAEDGGLGEGALQWQVDGVSAGSGSIASVDGLASGAHTAALSATDSNSQTVTTSVTFNLAPLSIPLGAAPVMDGVCNDAGYTAAVTLQLKPYGDATPQATVQLMRTADDLWVCFSNLKPGTDAPGGYAGLRADINNSRDPLAQASDAGFFVAKDGSVFTRAGNGAGNLVAPGPGGLQGQVTTDANGWNAELRIEKAALGGWNHLVSLALGHHSVSADDDDYAWPYAAAWGKPNSWSPAALGIQPLITSIDPATAPMLAASFTLTVEGSSLVSGTQVLWNGTPLATTFGNSEQLTAQVPAANLTAAAVVTITTRSSAPDSFVSNGLPFVVEALPPVITGFSPANATAGDPAMTLTINGSNFGPNAKVLWNGVELATQFVNATQLTAQVAATLLERGQIVGITVSNPTPGVQISSVVNFNVQDPEAPNQKNYMPGLFK
ncbi:MAG: IPT/TIG domain-containing protein [Caldilineaceae bacterium]|nr:IPT/TIG domain-containing protein [Caldilineaceae bacterium]